MKCWPLDLRHLQRDSGFSAGFGAEGEPAYTLVAAATGGNVIPAVAVEYESDMKVWPISMQNALHNSDVPAGGVGIGKENSSVQTMRADGKPPAVALAFDAWSSTVDSMPEEDCTPAMKCGTRIGVCSETGEGMEDEPKYVVRRITPVEAERLQGFPDGWTDVEFKGKPAPDTARYKALGNSMTVNVMQWIAKRILMVEKGEL